ncbi:MAG: hypothetical protein Q9211_005842 [Gyalolechia sp. 1 TL-2023]
MAANHSAVYLPWSDEAIKQTAQPALIAKSSVSFRDELMGNLRLVHIWLVAFALLLPPALSAVIGISEAHPGLRLPRDLPTRSASRSISKRNLLNEYSQHYMGRSLILPIRAAAAFLEDILETLSTTALYHWLQQTPNIPFLSLEKDNVALAFLSSDYNVPVPWEFVIHFCEQLAIEVARGWTGVYEGSWTHSTTQVVIFVRMSINLVAAAA